MSGPLPPEVLALLGDDATPEGAIVAANRGTATYVDNLKQPDGDDNDAMFAWYGMLAAAAIRECETGRAFTAALRRPKEQCEVASDAEVKHREAMAAYDSLRNWRKR